MKHLQTYRLYENPNTININDQDVDWNYGKNVDGAYHDDATVSFSYYFGNFYTTNETHEDLFYENEINFVKPDGISKVEYNKKIDEYNDEYGRGELSGRLYPRYKTITFWDFPKDNAELKKVCDVLLIETGYDIWFEDGWNIEILDEEVNLDWGDWDPSEDDRISHIPIKNYKSSKKRTAEELRQAHVKVGKGGKVDGFGTDYYTDKLPSGMSQSEYRNKKTKYKYTERQEYGYEINDIDLFNPVEDKNIYISKLETDLPKMDSVKDFAAWLVDKIPMEQKLNVLKNVT